MRDDRLPKTPVVEDKDANAEEMSVQLSPRELISLLDPTTAESLLSGRFEIEPWVRVTKGADWEISTGIEATPADKDDGA